MKNLSLRLVVLVVLTLPLPSVVFAAEFRLAVTSPRGVEDQRLWKAFAAYLSEKTGEVFVVTALPPARVSHDFESGAISLGVVNPVSAVDVLENGPALPLATLKVKGMTEFAGVIFARADRGMKTMADLRGKSLITYQTSSAGAYVFQMYHALRSGLDIARDFQSIRKAARQDDIVAAVATGGVDVGFVRSGLLETLAQEGKLRLADFTIIDAKTDNLRVVHTTPLYPEWFLLASRTLDAQLVARIKSAALALRSDHAAAREAGIDGFVEPLSLDRVREAMRALRLPPFDR